jgi:hypothetical protein
VTIQPEALTGKGQLSPTYESGPVSQPQTILYPNNMFKVDTFEYRLLREIEYRQNITRKYQDDPDIYVISPPTTAPGPPRVIQKPKNLKIVAGQTAQFFVKVEGVNTKVVWFRYVDVTRCFGQFMKMSDHGIINYYYFNLCWCETDELGMIINFILKLTHTRIGVV